MSPDSQDARRRHAASRRARPPIRRVACALVPLLLAACSGDRPATTASDARPDVPEARTVPPDPGTASIPDADVSGAGDPAPDLTPPARDTPAATDLPAPDRNDADPPGPSCPPVGALLITEIMADPASVPDAVGEYVEILNNSDTPYDLRGLALRSGTRAHRIEESLPRIARPGARIVVAANVDPGVNGGFRADLPWTGLRLGNARGDVAIVCGDTWLDGVAWDDATWPMDPGRALVLDPEHLDATANDVPAAWCGAGPAFGAGDRGTPGLPDTPCAERSCGDGVRQSWEDCDDGNVLSGDGCSARCRVEAFAPGAVVVTEFHYDPAAAGASGEFVELHNATSEPVDIAGWTLSDERHDRVRILPDGGTLPIAPGGFAVLGRSTDPARNGGLAVDWAYGDRFVLAAPEDRIVLSWNGVAIDRVDYRIADDGFPEAVGRSLALDGTCLDAELNDCGAFWCATPDAYATGVGDPATAGAPNPPCP